MSIKRTLHFWAVFVLLCALPVAAHAQGSGPEPAFDRAPTPLSQWVAKPGDVLIADTWNNIGYLMHEDGDYVALLMASGQRRVVTWRKMTYNATTPEGIWVAKDHEKKGDLYTFGPEGDFLRMYYGDDEEYTAYGIHTHAMIDAMLARPNRFASMGCLLFSQDVYNLIQQTYEQNGNTLTVMTKAGLENQSIDFATLFNRTQMSKLGEEEAKS